MHCINRYFYFLLFLSLSFLSCRPHTEKGSEIPIIKETNIAEQDIPKLTNTTTSRSVLRTETEVVTDTSLDADEREDEEENSIETEQSSEATPTPLAPVTHLQKPSNNTNEAYINRWEDIEGVTIDLAINDPNGEGKLWFVGSCIAEKGKNIEIYHHYFNEARRHIYYRYTNNILFNWLHRAYLSNIHTDDENFYILRIPVPLIAPLKEKEDMNPYDPAISYKDDVIEINYKHIFENSFNTASIGALNRADSWMDVRPTSQPDDLVDIVIYIYSLDKSYTWFHNLLLTESNEAILEGLRSAHVEQLIELQRFPILLQ